MHEELLRSTHQGGVLKGHDFSRAANAKKYMRGLQPLKKCQTAHRPFQKSSTLLVGRLPAHR
jgi:hypothetical protein